MRLSKPQKLIYDMEKFVGESISVICGSMLFSGDFSIQTIDDAINNLYRLNDALRIRIFENGGEIGQIISDYNPNDTTVLHFEYETELDAYAKEYAKIPLDFHGNLSEFHIIVLPDRYGILVKLHHIIGDAWTLSLIGNQLNALLNGETPEVYSYADFLETEAAYLQSKRYEKDKAFFLEQFKKCDEVTYLSEKQNDSYNAARKTFILDKAQTKTILEYAQRKQISAFTLFTAALAVYMNRVKMNAEKFYLGTAVLNRGNSKEKNTMGMFINTVPMLMELDNQKSFAENLSVIESATLAVFRHQKYNYGDVLADLRKEYNFSEKLYDVILSYQNATVTGGDCETTWYACGIQTESLQIHIDDRDNEGIFRIHYDYLTDKFTAHEIQMLHEHMTNLVFSAIENDGKKIYELNIFSSAERQTVLFDFNDTAFDYPKDKCVHELFEAQVAATPDNIAIVAQDQTLTFRQVNEEANRIAHSLLSLEITSGGIVAVILPRTSHLIPAMFGVLKAGAAYMPVDPSYPQERIDYLLTESNTKFILNENMLFDFLENSNSENPNVSVNSGDYFCAMHTSGSTGQPKLSVLTQRNLLNFLYSNIDFWNDIEASISVTLITFDAFMLDSILPLVLGKKLILASNEQIYNQFEFEKMFENENNVMFFSTPTKLISYIKQSKTCDFLQKITSLIVGGEVFTDELYDLLIEKMNHGNVHNGYGPTETTLGITFDNVLPPRKFHNRKLFNAYGPMEATIIAAKTLEAFQYLRPDRNNDLCSN